MLLIDLIPQEVFLTIFEFHGPYITDLSEISDNINRCIRYYMKYNNRINMFVNMRGGRKTTTKQIQDSMLNKIQYIPRNIYFGTMHTIEDDEFTDVVKILNKKYIDNTTKNLKLRQKYSQHKCIELMNKSKIKSL